MFLAVEKLAGSKWKPANDSSQFYYLSKEPLILDQICYSTIKTICSITYVGLGEILLKNAYFIVIAFVVCVIA